MNDLMVHQNDDLAPIADDFLISMADQAERRIDAVIKIKQVALKVTNARDWTDQNGNPYLQVSGSEKIANLFNMSWRLDVPQYEEEPDGHFTYSIKGTFALGARTIEVEGTRSSKDPFFNRYDYSQPKDAVTKKHPVLPPHTIDKGDVKKAALTNLYGNGITRMLGIRNLTWEDLEKYAGITQKMIEGKISYNQREAGDVKPPIATPKAKTEAKTEPKAEPTPPIEGSQSITTGVLKITPKTGKGPHRIFDAAGTAYNTFHDNIKTTAEEAQAAGLKVKITYKTGQYGHDIETLEKIEG
jgi:hypothetical protein